MKILQHPHMDFNNHLCLFKKVPFECEQEKIILFIRQQPKSTDLFPLHYHKTITMKKSHLSQCIHTPAIVEKQSFSRQVLTGEFMENEIVICARQLAIFHENFKILHVSLSIMGCHKCPFCNRKFSTKYNVECHIATHLYFRIYFLIGYLMFVNEYEKSRSREIIKIISRTKL